MTPQRRFALLLVGLLGASPVVAGTGTADASAAPVTARYIAVSVATLWTEPGPKRPVDAPALANPARPREWVDTMSLAEKRWLSATGAVQTQALLGTKVYVLGTSGLWTEIAVSGQPTPKNRLGYPGWVPTKQLTTTPPVTAQRVAVIREPTTWLWGRWGAGGVSDPVMELSYDTRLPIVKLIGDLVVVATRPGQHRAILRSSVVVHDVGSPWHPMAGQILADARSFLGLQYLWAGTSGFGFDCSGFTHSLYRRAGITIPRDASAQATHGRPVGMDALRLGDLLFVAGSSGSIDHVVMYDGVVAGRRSVIEAPHTGVGVRVVPLTTYSYTGARRYLPS